MTLYVWLCLLTCSLSSRAPSYHPKERILSIQGRDWAKVNIDQGSWRTYQILLTSATSKAFGLIYQIKNVTAIQKINEKELATSYCCGWLHRMKEICWEEIKIKSNQSIVVSFPLDRRAIIRKLHPYPPICNRFIKYAPGSTRSIPSPQRR